MPRGVRPRVNEAREFLEIAKDFKDPKEIIREALSNSWDAGATAITISFDLLPVLGSRAKKIRVTIEDDGDGMSSDPRPMVGSSEIEGFFNLGDSGKQAGSIGTKGHGTKIYYKSQGITVDSWKNGKHIHAAMDVDPWDALQHGVVPTYSWDETEDHQGKGTQIVIDGFQGKQAEFSDLKALMTYIGWFTIAGSFGHAFDQSRTMDIRLKPIGVIAPVTLTFGFRFPDPSSDLATGSEDVCKLFGPEELDAGMTPDGKHVKVQVYGAILGEAKRGAVPNTYTHMGLWLAKDFIRIERNNALVEDAFGGQYFYRNFLLMANCQQFDLTANRNNIRGETDEYDLALGAIKQWCTSIMKSDFTRAYFERKRQEDQDKDASERERRVLERRQSRVDGYDRRPNLSASHVVRAPIKEPKNEAETALLLQAMISSNHPEVDFTIGDYNTSFGVDLLVERTNKGLPTRLWVELVHTLDKLTQWAHHPDGYHAVICYGRGRVADTLTFPDGRTARLISKDAPGRYTMLLGNDTFDVYVLSEVLGIGAS